jgi:hypothetical protein
LESHGTFVDKSFVVNGVSFRNSFYRSSHNGIVFFGFNELNFVGLLNQEQGQSQVDESILELFKGRETLSKLVELSGDSTSDHSRGRGDGRDDSSGNHLGLAEVAFGDLVVTGAQLGSRVNEINVVVCLIILLELNNLEAILLQILHHFF